MSPGLLSRKRIKMTTNTLVVKTESGRIYSQNFNIIDCYTEKGSFLFSIRLPTSDESSQVLEDMTTENEIIAT